MKILGPWERERIDSFLDQTLVPLRLSFHSASGYPAIVSLWFLRRGNALWCATPETSVAAEALRSDSRCGFEVAVNEPPYRGVRGPADVTIEEDRGDEMLTALIDRYLGDRRSRFAQWLLERPTQELALRLDPIYLSAWDYGERMRDIAPRSNCLPLPGYSSLAEAAPSHERRASPGAE